MPFKIPSEAQLTAQAQADFASRLPGGDPLLPRSVAAVYATVFGGAIVGAYENIGWLARQLFDDTAEAEFLERRAATFGLHRKPPSYAQGPIIAVGNQTLPAGTVLARGDGQQYATQADAVPVAGVATALVQAVIPGSAGNSAAGVALTFAGTIAGFAAGASVASAGISAGSDQESDDGLRARLILRRQQPPQGGASNDYVEWAESVPGVTRVWVYPGWLGAGTVGVTFVMDGRANIVPQPADVAAVQAAINAVRPVTAAVTVFAPTPVAIPLGVTLVPNSTATRAAVDAALADLFARESIPGGLLYRSHIDQAIADTAGIVDHTVTAIAGAAPANIAMPAGQLAQLGLRTYAG